jgi:hypothetical protein
MRLINHFSTCTVGLFIFSFFYGTTYAQVGIGTTNPTETLDVVGNIKYSGALMPYGITGNTGQVLSSAGAGNPNVWGADLGNITSVIRYETVNGVDINANTTTNIIVSIAGSTAFATAMINIQGDWFEPIGDEITIHNIEMHTDEIRFSVTNNTGRYVWIPRTNITTRGEWIQEIGYNYGDMIFNITVVQ